MSSRRDTRTNKAQAAADIGQPVVQSLFKQTADFFFRFLALITIADLSADADVSSMAIESIAVVCLSIRFASTPPRGR
jgi:hypothetical protein